MGGVARRLQRLTRHSAQPRHLAPVVALDQHVVHVDRVQRALLWQGRWSKINRPTSWPQLGYSVEHAFMNALNDVQCPLPAHGNHSHQRIEHGAPGQ
eukprot:4543762-Pyramimonas_sp.AAC.1